MMIDEPPIVSILVSVMGSVTFRPLTLVPRALEAMTARALTPAYTLDESRILFSSNHVIGLSEQKRNPPV